MNNVSVCKKCQGLKKVAPLGGIYKDCDECAGIGWLNVILPKKKDGFTVIDENNFDKILTPKRRGRPKFK